MQKVDSFDMVLFGGTGDLALRKLVPALYLRHAAGQIGTGARVIAVARANITREEYLAQIDTLLDAAEGYYEHWTRSSLEVAALERESEMYGRLQTWLGAFQEKVRGLAEQAENAPR